jgi:hypothetical protein
MNQGREPEIFYSEIKNAADAPEVKTTKTE